MESNKIIQTRSKGKAAITEFRILEAEGAGANEVGSRASWYLKMANDATLGNIKQYISALTGKDPKEVSPKMAENTYRPDSPVNGTKVRAEAVQITTKANTPFTRVDFTQYKDTKK